MFYAIDPVYYLFALPGLILSLIASGYVESVFAKYSKIRSRTGITGAEAAHRMLASQGITDVQIRRIDGFLSDHYNPGDRTLNLSPDVYDSDSLSAIGVACHEAGHALQHAQLYKPLALRTALVLPVNLGPYAAYLLVIIGTIIQSTSCLYLGIAFFSLATIFAFVTLPVEWNASSRAKQAMLSAGFLTPGELVKSSSVLNAAFLTYVAAAVAALLQFIYILHKLGLLGGRRR